MTLTRYFPVLVTIVLGGCQLQAIAPNDVPVVDATGRPSPVVAENNERILELLEQARSALEDNRLTTPVDDNAYLRYLQVLAITPDQPDALLGIAAVVDRYLSWAIDDIYAGYYTRAGDYINKAASVDENHPNLAATRRLLARYRDGTTDSYAFDRRTIENSPDTLTGEFTHIAMEINEKDADVVIEAPTDAIGRWLYQQLNEVLEARVRARFELTNRVRVHLHYQSP